MAETDRVDLAIFDRRPGVHRHRVGIVQELRTRFCDRADILAEIENDGNVALAVEDAAGADRIADALVDAIFQRNADVIGIGFQTADANAADDVARTFQRLQPIGRRRHLRRQAVDLDDSVEDRLDHLQIAGTEVGQRHFDITQFRHGENVGKELLGEADAAGADDGDLECCHALSLLMNCTCV
ncbi:hypothetical protein D9M70_486680 [compost metagenome]